MVLTPSLWKNSGDTSGDTPSLLIYRTLPRSDSLRFIRTCTESCSKNGEIFSFFFRKKMHPSQFFLREQNHTRYEVMNKTIAKIYIWFPSWDQEFPKLNYKKWRLGVEVYKNQQQRILCVWRFETERFYSGKNFKLELPSKSFFDETSTTLLTRSESPTEVGGSEKIQRE